MRDHAEVGDYIWWPSEPRAWVVASILITLDGYRYLKIHRGGTSADRVTRVVPEPAVTSNAFQVPA